MPRPKIVKKTYNEHKLTILCEYDENNDRVTLLGRCRTCNLNLYYKHREHFDDDDLVIMEFELQMHAYGVNDGWETGVEIRE